MKLTTSKLPHKAKLLAIAITAGLFSSTAVQAAGELNIYNWSDYMDQAVLDKFSKKYDVKVTYDTYDSNETLLSKLKSGVTGYDVAVPGDYMVKILIDEDLLEKIEGSKLSNYKNIKSELKDVYYDPGHQYSVPYQTGTTSFVVDTDVYKGDINSLDMLFNPPEELKGKINMFRDVNNVINAALRYKGFEICNNNREELKQVNDLLIEAKQNWQSIASDGAKEMLITGDVALSMAWNGMALQARLEKPSLQYAYPKENMTAWADNLVVLKGSKNIENAKLFLNFMLEPENAAAISNVTGYTPGVVGADQYLVAEFKGAPEFTLPEGNPTPQFVPPCSPEVVKFYDRIWTNLLR
ncbi:extracellular solute-binding protein [uncultured Psychromonas sp.]|uniref:extracellular solute-binding protein n=1 Tax=uncultured Psychromonas sp. TaxID=173974 RepID=UPI00260EDF8A|nr:extracellular solute-binding protein [uncultured Psychromonas sp.]